MLKTYGRVKPYLFYFSQTKRCKIGHKLSCHGSSSSRIPLHFHLPIYRSLGVTKFCVYTTWYTVQIHLLEHSRVKICHRGATGQSEGLGPCQGPNVCMYGGTTFDTNTHFLPNFRVALQLNLSLIHICRCRRRG